MRILFLFLYTLFAGCIFSQSSQKFIDSLVLILEREPVDSAKVDLMYQISSKYRYLNLDKTIEYSNQALELSKKAGYKTGEVKHIYSLSVAQRYLGNMDLGIKLGKQSLSLAKEYNKLRWVGANSNSLGNAYSHLGIYDSATIFFYEAIDAYEAANLPIWKGSVYNNLSHVFDDQNKDDIAKEYLLKALKIFQEAEQMNKAAMVFMNLGKREKKDSLAFDYLNRALKIHTENDNLTGIASVNMNIGSRKIFNNKFQEALAYYKKALELSEKVGNQRKMETALSSIGKIYQELNQTKKAVEYYNKVLKLTEETSNIKETKETHQNLARLYTDLKDFESANKSLFMVNTLSDSLNRKKNLSITAELESKYKAKEQEAALASQELKISKQKNIQNNILIGIALVLLLLSIAFQRYYYSQKKKKQEAQLALEKQSVEADNLRQLDQLKTKFFANISHEFRTPMTMIISPLEKEVENSKDPKVKNNLSLALNNSKKLLHFVNELLKLSKLEAGQLELQQSVVHLNQFVKRIFFAFQSVAQVRNINFEFNFNLPEDTALNIDTEKFEIILNNLISNALKFSHEGDKIALTLDTKFIDSEEKLMLSLSDEGTGIAKDEIDKIFNRYYQGKAGKAAGGTGIGLALSKELANLMGGDLSVDSVLQQGSTFELCLPLQKTSLEEQALQEEKIEANELAVRPNKIYNTISQNGKKPKILITEDNLELSKFLFDILSTDYECHTAFSGKEALEKINTEKFDLITSDIMMPEMDGFEFRAKLNQSKINRQIPFILLSARVLESDKLQGFKLGIDDYITKPFSTKELMARIENLLRNKKEREEFVKKEPEEAKVVSAEEELVLSAEKIVVENLDNSIFRVNDLAKEIGYSQRQLSRILKKLTGLSPVNFILEIRLQKAHQLLSQKKYHTVSEVRYAIGIESATYFTTKFKSRFGRSPKEYL